MCVYLRVCGPSVAEGHRGDSEVVRSLLWRSRSSSALAQNQRGDRGKQLRWSSVHAGASAQTAFPFRVRIPGRRLTYIPTLLCSHRGPVHLPSSSLRKTSPLFPTAAPAWGPGIPSDTGLLPSCRLSNSVPFGEDVCASQLRLHPQGPAHGTRGLDGGWMDRQMDGKQEGRWGLEKGDLWCGGGQGLPDRVVCFCTQPTPC